MFSAGPDSASNCWRSIIVALSTFHKALRIDPRRLMSKLLHVLNV
jgi:hypothetical protein